MPAAKRISGLERLVLDAVNVLQEQFMSLKQQSCDPAAGSSEEQIANDPSAVLVMRAIVLNTRKTGQRFITMQFEYPVFKLQCSLRPASAVTVSRKRVTLCNQTARMALLAL